MKNQPITATAAVDKAVPVKSDLSEPVSDYQKYQTLSKAMGLLIQDGLQDTPFFHAMWAETERLKNLNKGMPPKQIAEKS